MIRLCLLLLFIAICFAQRRANPHPPEDLNSPEAIEARKATAMAERQKNIIDARDLLILAKELKADVDKEDPHVVSVATVKKTQDIEKLAKRIRGRLQ